MALYSCYSKSGCRRLPRAFRCLRGWRLLSPSSSRRPWDWPVWAALAVELCRMELTAVAFGVLLMIECYLRPGELLGLTRDALLPPRPGSEHWTVLLYPQHRPERSKTGTSDDTVILDSPRTPWLKRLVAAAAGDSSEKVLAMEYPEFADGFSRGAEAIGVGLVPYQARHSGASIDAANNVRGLPSIQKRGRWASKKSVQRYEKAGRLQDTWRDLTARQKDHFKLCAESLRSVMLENRGFPPVMRA